MGKKKNVGKRKEKKDEVEKIINEVQPYPWKQCSPSKGGPAGRMGSALIAAPSGYGCDIFVAGGYNTNGSNEEVWKFSVGNNSWERVRTKSGPSPYPRIMTKYCSLAKSDGLTLFLFGGTGETGENVADLWELPLSQEPPLRWKSIKLVAMSSLVKKDAAAAEEPILTPPARCNHAMTVLPNNHKDGGGFLFIHGGESDTSPIPLNDFWVVEAQNDASTMRCIQVPNEQIPGLSPTPRCSHEAIVMPTSRSICFFGGVGVPSFSTQETLDPNITASSTDNSDSAASNDQEFDGIMPLNDLFILHLGDTVPLIDKAHTFGSMEFFSNWRWSCISIGENAIAPSPRSLPALAVSMGVHGETIHVFGGYGLYEQPEDNNDTSVSEEDRENMIQIGYLNDLWAFNVSMNKWVCSKDAEELEVHGPESLETPKNENAEIETIMQELSPRNGHGLCLTHSSDLVTFGGYNGNDFIKQVLVAPSSWADQLLATNDDDDEEEGDDNEEEGDNEEGDDNEEEKEGENLSVGAGGGHIDIIEKTSNLTLNPKEESRQPINDNEEEEEDVSGGGGGKWDEEDDEEERKRFESKEMKVKIRMWEFSQNDPKRDSGSKLVRFGMAKILKVNQSFSGIVLSSEASNVLSPADLDIVLEKGVGGVNCSWNRLDEVPSRRLGNPKYHRLLPRLLAANPVNYGRPFKMNTAEACAAALYIVGLKDDARQLLAPFSYGEEFIRLNQEALDAYCQAKNSNEVREVEALFEEERERAAAQKQVRQNREGSNYMADMDLPPSESEEEYEEEEEEEGDEEE